MATSTMNRAPLPEGLDVELRKAGVFWDAVKMPCYLGDRVLAALDEDCGAVIRDPYAHSLFFLVRPGVADDWRFPDEAHVRVIGKGGWVGVPPAHCSRSADVYWARPVVNSRVLTRSRRLHAAIQDVIGKAVPQ